MNILQRYLVKTMAFYTSTAMFILLSVYGFLKFINEIKHIGQAHYTTFKALIYVLMDLPAVLYSHSPVIILLGSLLALNHLASTSQLIVIRAAGVSIMDIARIVMGAALSFFVVAVLVGELMAPTATEYAKYAKNQALGYNQTAQNQPGFWLKDGNFIIQVEKNPGEHLLENITLFNLNNATQLGSIVYADKASFDDKNLSLKAAKGYKLDYAKGLTAVTPEQHTQYNTQVSFNKKMITDLKKPANELSIWNLYQQIVFLNNSQLAANVLEIEFYKRLIKPLTMMAMILFSMLFIFGSLRDSSLGKKVFLGLILSLFFELSSRIGGVVSLKFDYSPFLSASMPTLIVLVVAFLLLRKKSSI